MDDDRIKYLEMVQEIIKRLTERSSLQKNFATLIFSGLIVLSGHSSCLNQFLGIIPFFGLWGLDAYYLRQERLFRRLYDSICFSKKEVDFSMATNKFSHLESYIKIAQSGSILWFYLLFIIPLICKALFCRYKG